MVETIRKDVWVSDTADHFHKMYTRGHTNQTSVPVWKIAFFKTAFNQRTFHFGRYYEGATPKIVTTDLEIAKQVFIKNFSKFHIRVSLLESS